MPNTTGYSFGDVVLVPFPFTDQTAAEGVFIQTCSRHHRAGLILRKLRSVQDDDVQALRAALPQILG